MRASGTIAILFAASGILGVVILALDKGLQSVPTHYDALIGFVIIDLIVGILVLAEPTTMMGRLAAVWSGLRILIQIADLTQAPSYQFTYAQFANYLFNPLSSPPGSFGIPAMPIDLILIIDIIVLAMVLRAPRKAASETKQNGRRKALKIIIGAGILAIAVVVANTLKMFAGSPETRTTTTSEVAATNTGVAAGWPRLRATNLKSLQLLTPLAFDYPTKGQTNILVKLGVKADNGVGPDGDVVAFSRICQHLGCIYSFSSNPPEGSCPCHGSVYDFVHNGAVVSGPAPNPVPRVLLEYDQATGDIYVAGMGPPAIYGYKCGPTDSLIQCDIGTGQVVTQITLSPV
jgi:arsenite oxidase small subunit